MVTQTLPAEPRKVEEKNEWELIAERVEQQHKQSEEKGALAGFLSGFVGEAAEC